MVRWVIELSKYDILYKPRGPIKGQVYVKFVVELALQNLNMEDFVWILSVDRLSNLQGSGAGIILEDLDGVPSEQSLKFTLKASNNQAKYETLIAGMLFGKELRVPCLLAKSESLLITSQVSGDYHAKDPQLEIFSVFDLLHVPRDKNSREDLLSKLASSRKGGAYDTMIQETVKTPRVTT
ncbi:uncharacterized protein [Phaseolus vulgaris]|uniref:uncharacterized protein n=1 Tax=Phaseolus vulgaris TaxID=3885 RepID=UPI0035CBB3E5